MSKVIWKFPLDIHGWQTLELPADAQILTVGLQDDGPKLWCLVDDPANDPWNRPLCERRTFHIVGTGESFDDDRHRYLGTFLLRHGALVFHVFEVADADPAA